MEVIRHYFKDDVEVPYEEWTAALNADCDEERRKSLEEWFWPIGDTIVNGHSYQIREEKIFPTASETLSHLFARSDLFEAYEAIEKMGEEKAREFLGYFRRARAEYDYYVLLDEKDFIWSGENES